MKKLVRTDLLSLEAYAQQRADFRARVMAHKKKRTVHLGNHLTLIFEDRQSIQYQVQEMLRIERIFEAEGIQDELDAYNPLIPEAGQLSATLFVELTSKEQLQEWLPKLVGIERSVELLVGEGERATVVRCRVDDAHAARLTREEVTASVHYVHFDVPAAVVDRWLDEPVVLAVNHPAYAHGVNLSIETKGSLLGDLRP